MKVTGTNGVGPAGGARHARPGSGGEGFRLTMPAPAAGPGVAASVSAASSLMGVDALLALQDVGGPLERRRRAVGRAGRILDVLEDVKVGLLEGGLSSQDLDRLRSAVRDERAQTDDPKLEGLLDEVELRAAVEIAKLEQARRAA
jgi:hypothetical protein